MESGILPEESNGYFSDKEIREIKKQYAVDSPILRLLARLEAAEAYIRSSVCDPDTTKEMWKNYQAWRKAAGKGYGDEFR